jgi:hypothetical protein
VIVGLAGRFDDAAARANAAQSFIGSMRLAYRGYKTYLFDGPHYVSPELVQGLVDAYRRPAAMR